MDNGSNGPCGGSDMCDEIANQLALGVKEMEDKYGNDDCPSVKTKQWTKSPVFCGYDTQMRIECDRVLVMEKDGKVMATVDLIDCGAKLEVGSTGLIQVYSGCLDAAQTDCK